MEFWGDHVRRYANKFNRSYGLPYIIVQVHPESYTTSLPVLTQFHALSKPLISDIILNMIHLIKLYTPWKFNIAPENKPSQKESNLQTIIFQEVC